jgi:hypothetical protein
MVKRRDGWTECSLIIEFNGKPNNPRGLRESRTPENVQRRQPALVIIAPPA